MRNDTLLWEILQFVNENEENSILFFNFIIPIIIHKILALHSNVVRVFVRSACLFHVYLCFFLSLKAQSFCANGELLPVRLQHNEIKI